MLYSGVILKQATTALRRCLDSSLCHTIFFDLKGCSVYSMKKMSTEQIVHENIYKSLSLKLKYVYLLAELLGLCLLLTTSMW